MPAPQGAILLSTLKGALPPDFDQSHPPMAEFMQTITNDISLAWLQWHMGLLGGLNNVTGAGIGVWAGVGTGGKLNQTAPFMVNHTWAKDDPDGSFGKLKEAITNELKKQFNMYANSFIFGTVPYLGTSTATPITPGVFIANNTPGPLTGYKAAGNAPASIAAGIRASLPSDWAKDPLDKFLDGLETSITQNFSIWEATSQFTGDLATGVAAPGAGAGVTVSTGIGVLV